MDFHHGNSGLTIYYQYSSEKEAGLGVKWLRYSLSMEVGRFSGREADKGMETGKSSFLPGYLWTFRWL